MEENKNLETKQNSSLYGDSQTGTEKELVPQDDRESAIYGQTSEQTETKTVESVETTQSAPIRLEKTIQPNEQNTQTFAQDNQLSNNSSDNAVNAQKDSADQSTYKPQQGINQGQPLYGNQPGMNQGQPLYGSQPGANQGQPLYGSQPGANQGQPLYGNQPGMNQGQPLYGSQPGMNQGQPLYVNQPGMNQGQPLYGNQPGVNQGQPLYGNQPGMNQGQPLYGNQPGMNQGQPLYGGQPNFVPGQMQNSQGPKPKKKMAGVMIGILAVASVALIVVLGSILSKTLFRKEDPKVLVEKGMENMTLEMEAYTSSIAEEIGVEALETFRNNQSVHSNIDLSFTAPYALDMDNINVELDAIVDYKNKKAMCELIVGAYGFDLSAGEFVASDNTLYVESPFFLGDNVYSVNLDNLGSEFNRSAWSDILGMELDENQIYTLFGATETVESNQYDEELKALAQKYSDKIAEAASYELLDTKKEFELGDKMVSCRGVSYTVPKDVYNEMIIGINKDIQESEFYTSILTEMVEEASAYDVDIDELRTEVNEFLDEALSIRLEQDYVVNFYLDPKGRIINISTPKDIAVKGDGINIDAFSIDIQFTGQERTLDEIEGGIYFRTGSRVLYLGIEREASVTQDMYSEDILLLLQEDNHEEDITFRYWNDWSYTDKTYDLRFSIDSGDANMIISADGGFSDIVPGEGYTFHINNAVLNIDGEDLLIISGKIKTGAAKEEIKVPSHSTNLLEMSELEIWNLLSGTDTFYADPDFPIG